MGLGSPYPRPKESISALIVLSIILCFNSVSGYLRYSDQSCSDLVPRNVIETAPIEENNQYYGNGNSNANGVNEYGYSNYGATRTRIRNRYRRSVSDYGDEPPYKVIITGRRYRRNSDLLGE